MKGDPFSIAIEQYDGDFICVLFKDINDNGVGLYNLLSYLKVEERRIQETNSFLFLNRLNEDELTGYWKKQFGKITFTIHKNLPTIRDWFSHEHFEKRHEKLKEHFMKPYRN